MAARHSAHAVSALLESEVIVSTLKARLATSITFITFIAFFTTMNFLICDERPDDAGAIYDLTKLAFEDKSFSSKTEHLIVNSLRAADAMAVSLVAVADDRVLGHVAFSNVSMSNAEGTWYVLGPVSVSPERQRQGIGAALIREGLSRVQQLGAAGCVLAGDPQYYIRFGFGHDPSVVLDQIPPEVSLVLRFRPTDDHGFVKFHPAFAVA